MDVLQAFCQCNRLTVNIGKTKAMVISRKSTGLAVTYEGQQIEQVQTLR